MGNRLSRGAIILLVLISASPCRGEDLFNVDFALGWDGCYRPTEWTPVEVGVQLQRKEPFGGAVTLTAQQDGLTNLTVTRPFVVTQDMPVRMPMVTKLAFTATQAELSITDDRGKVRWSNDYSTYDYRDRGTRSTTALNASDCLIGLCGRRAFALLPLGDKTRSRQSSGKVYAKTKLPPGLPWDWTGYASLDLLVLNDMDWSRLNTHQATAIAQWVLNGGRLLIVMGAAPMPREGPVAALLPFRIGDARELHFRPETMLDGLPSAGEGDQAGSGIGGQVLRAIFSGPRRAAPSPAPRTAATTQAASQAASQPVDPSETRVAGWTLPEITAFGWQSQKLGGQPVFAHGPAGFGTVGLLVFDPGEVAQGDAAVGAWARYANALLGLRGLEMGAPREAGYNDYHIDLGPEQNATNAVMDHLLSIVELRPLSIWWVIGLLALLATLLGPVDYLVLKKLDRLPLTWLTSAGIILLFTVGAYYGVQALRAGSMQMRIVSVSDAVQGQPAWTTSFCGIFAPASKDFHLDGLQPTAWWAGAAPTSDSEIYRYREQVATRRIYCLQQDGGNLPTNLPINIWSMQCLTCEYPSASLPASIQTKMEGPTLVLTVANHSKEALSGGWAAFGDATMGFSGVEAGKTAEFRLNADAPSANGPHVPDGVMGSLGAKGCGRRTAAIDDYRKLGAVVVYLYYGQAEPFCTVADMSCRYDHLRILRLVVFPGGPSPARPEGASP